MRKQLAAATGAGLLLALVPASQAAAPKVTGTVGPGYCQPHESTMVGHFKVS